MNIKSITHNKTSFIVCTDPKTLEMKYLKNNFGFSQLHLEDYINKTQVPKIETNKGYTLVVLDFPYFYQNGAQKTETSAKNDSILAKFFALPQVSLPPVPLPTFTPGDKKPRILSSQVDFFIGRDFLIVLHDGILSPIDEVFALCQKTLRKRTELMEKGPTSLFYYLIDSLVDGCFPVINEISATIDRIDKELVISRSGKILEDISTTRRNIVVFHTILKPFIPLFKELEEGKYKDLDGEMAVFWGNILDHLQKIWDRLEDSRELIEGIATGHESFLTSRTNRIITILTIFSAILLPLNLLAGIYGMNIELPLARVSSAFAIIVLLMGTIAGTLFLLFKTRRWF